jgi:hypothetical protein
MKEPTAPEDRSCGLISACCDNRIIYIYDDHWGSVPVHSIAEAEMLIHALSEWVEYKRQLELWEREHTL